MTINTQHPDELDHIIGQMLDENMGLRRRLASAEIAEEETLNKLVQLQKRYDSDTQGLAGSVNTLVNELNDLRDKLAVVTAQRDDAFQQISLIESTGA